MLILQGSLNSLDQHPPCIVVGMVLHPKTPHFSRGMPRGYAWPSSSLHSSTCSRCLSSSRAINSIGTHNRHLPLDSWVGPRLHTTLPSCLPAQQWDPLQVGNPMGSRHNRSLGKLQTSLGGEAEVEEGVGHSRSPNLLCVSYMFSVCAGNTFCSDKARQ